MQHLQNEVITRDTQEACFLWLQPGFEFRRVFLKKRAMKGHTVMFVFGHGLTENQLASLRNDFYNGKTSVEPKTFLQKLEDVKNILHEALRSGTQE